MINEAAHDKKRRERERQGMAERQTERQTGSERQRQAKFGGMAWNSKDALEMLVAGPYRVPGQAAGQSGCLAT